MLEKISKFIVDKMKTNDKTIEGEKEEVILFGITRIVEDIPKFLGLIIICYCLGILKELGIVFLINMIFKPFIGGAHAQTNTACFFSTILFFLVIIYSSKYLVFGTAITLVIQGLMFLFGMYIINKYVPADTEEIPIINKKQRKTLQTIAYILFIIGNIISLAGVYYHVETVYTNYLVYTMFFINLMTIKPVYKFLGTKYGFLEYNEEGII